MDLNKLCNEAVDTSVERGQRKFDGKGTFRALKHCAGEVIEANEAYNDWAFVHNPKEGLKKDFENELADIIICVLSICGAENIDIEQAIERKMKINKERAK